MGDLELSDLRDGVDCIVCIFRASLSSTLNFALLKKRLDSDLLTWTRLVVSLADHVFNRLRQHSLELLRLLAQ